MAGPGRATIGLLNSYDPINFREAHRRALARAGALARAFDHNLATFGFPFPRQMATPQEIADWVASTTSIGEDGRYLVDLTAAGRFSTFPFPHRGFPPQLGEAVLTTSRPARAKSISVDEVCRLLQGGRGVCLILGLGPKGAPKRIFDITRSHLDITGRGRSLETCTAMGAVVAVISHAIRSSQ